MADFERRLDDVLDELGRTRLITLNTAQRRMAVLIDSISGRTDLALHWIRLRQRSMCKWKQGIAVNVTSEMLHRWRSDFEGETLFSRCLEQPGCALRAEAHRYLAESIVAEDVRGMGRRGIVVPSAFVLQKYMRLLRHVPQCPVIQQHLLSLETGASAGKKWSRRFRESWGFRFGGGKSLRQLSWNAAQRRTAIFHRWVKHVLRDRLCGRPVVVLNMDETTLSNIKRFKKGVVLSGGPPGMVEKMSQPDGAIPHTSLIATISSDAELQRHLPQVRLVRTPRGRVPGRRTLQHYCQAGAPQIAWHGGGGWNTVPSMLEYIRLIYSVCRKHLPGRAVVLVMDACSVHLTSVVLQAASRRGMQVVIVPAKMTWALQPLDVYVFRVLKDCARRLELDGREAAGEKRLTCLQRVLVHGDAVRRCLVNRQWHSEVVRCGLTGELAGTRSEVLSLLSGMDTAARAPSVDEVQEILQVPHGRARDLRALLLPALASPPPAARSPAPSASAAAMSSLEVEGGDSLRIPRPFLLTGLSRLPSRPAHHAADGANMWLPPWAAPRPVTRSMTAAARARGEDAPRSSTEGGARAAPSSARRASLPGRRATDAVSTPPSSSHV